MPPKEKETWLKDWGTSDAKELLRKDINEGRVTEEMQPKQVYGMHPEYKKYKYTNFTTNLKALRESIRDKGKYWTDWGTSEAKELLKKDIEEGRVTEQMQPHQVYEMHPEYKRYKYTNFTANLGSLKGAINDSHKHADFDDAALANDERLHPRSATTTAGLPRWDGSEAQGLLKMDVDDGKHDSMQPKDLYESRVEYEVFSLEVFRKHIYQETRKCVETPYWAHKRELKKKKKEEKNRRNNSRR